MDGEPVRADLLFQTTPVAAMLMDGLKQCPITSRLLSCIATVWLYRFDIQKTMRAPAKSII
jgi:hypothetical protein